MRQSNEGTKLNDSFLNKIPPPNPILPKYINVFEPPKCPMKTINFM
jgi:hypothetical protein